MHKIDSTIVLKTDFQVKLLIALFPWLVCLAYYQFAITKGAVTVVNYSEIYSATFDNGCLSNTHTILYFISHIFCPHAHSNVVDFISQIMKKCGLPVIINNLCGHTENAIIACGCPLRQCVGFLSGVIIFSGHTVNICSSREACGLRLCRL